MSNGREFQGTDAATGNERRPMVDRRKDGTRSDCDDNAMCCCCDCHPLCLDMLEQSDLSSERLKLISSTNSSHHRLFPTCWTTGLISQSRTISWHKLFTDFCFFPY